MTNYFFNSTNSIFVETADTSALQIGGTDNLFVASDGFLMAWGDGNSDGLFINASATDNIVIVEGVIYGTSVGINCFGTGASIDVVGRVYSEFGGIDLVGADNEVVVGPDGYVSGRQGITLVGSSNSVLNHGTITGETIGAIGIFGPSSYVYNAGDISHPFAAFAIDADNTTIVNAGTINGGVDVHFAENSASLSIENSGLWHGFLEFTVDSDALTNSGTVVGSVRMKAGDDAVINSGTIEGDVSLGDGSDLYRGAYGVVTGGFFGDVSGGLGNDTIIGGVGDEFFLGDHNADDLRGRAGDDVLDGGRHNDKLAGGQGDDTLIGGREIDLLTGGGGRDNFDFNSILDSGVPLASRDTIADFQKGSDRIDLSTIDADITTGGNQAFTFIGNSALSGTGEVRFLISGGKTIVLLSNDADSTAEMALNMDGSFNLTAIDFIL